METIKVIHSDPGATKTQTLKYPDPIFDEYSRVLILSSTQESKTNFYDGKYDYFWKAIKANLKEFKKDSPITLKQKKNLCKTHHIALAVVHDFKEYPELIAALQTTETKPRIYIYCTDKKAKALYDNIYKKDLKVEAVMLPKTSFEKSLSDTEFANLKKSYRQVLVQYTTRYFAPIYNKDSRILFLGTKPSDFSIKNEFYYGNPTNRFWQTMANAFGYKKEELQDNKARIAFCKKHQIALWDVIKACNMIAGADNTIQEDEDFTCFPIEDIIADSKIEKVFCTGKTSYEYYTKYCEKNTHIKAERLNSTSSSNRKPNEEIFKEYKKALTEE